MTAVERWTQTRQQLNLEAAGSKASHEIVVELVSAYRRLRADERIEVDAELARWLVSDDETARFDALAVVDANEICSAVPALSQLEHRLAGSDAPGAVYESAKVNRVIGRLAAVCSDRHS